MRARSNDRLIPNITEFYAEKIKLSQQSGARRVPSHERDRSTQPKPGEPSVCGHCAALVIFTDELELRALDWPDWCMLTYVKKGNLVATRAVMLARIRAARQ